MASSDKNRARRYAPRKKKAESRGFPSTLAYKRCETCGKQCYVSRNEARRSAKVNHPGQVMHLYECTEPSGRKWWHLSSIPADKLKTLKDRRA